MQCRRIYKLYQIRLIQLLRKSFSQDKLTILHLVLHWRTCFDFSENRPPIHVAEN